LTSHTLFLYFWNLKTIVTLHLVLPMSQKLFNSIGEGGRYGVFGVRGFIVWWWVDFKLKIFDHCIFAFDIQRSFVKP
jgi:hypothetical protein